MAQYLSNINLNGNELQNYIVQPLGTAPTTMLKAGRKYYNTAEGREALYNGSQWLQAAYLSDIEDVSGIATDIDERLQVIEAYFDTTEDADDAINKWNEIVEFLNATEGDTLDEILSQYVLQTRKVSAGTGLSGGGALSSDITLSLATVGTAGTYFKTTVDAYGRVTSGSNPTTLSGFGITDAYTKTDVDNLLKGLDVVSVTQTLTSGKQIATISVGETDTKLYAPASYAWSEITSKPNFATVATSGSYSDLSNKPTIATFMGSSAIGGTSSYIYWTGSTFTSKELGSLAFKSSLTASDVGATKKYATAITKGTATSYTITHSLGTRDVVVMVYDPSTYEKVMVDVTMTSTSVVTLTFGSAPTANYRVVVIG